MAKIRHIAISTQDPDATAKFYVDVFGLKQVGRVDSMGASGYYLTDGDINVAILKFKTDAAAGTERGTGWSGLHHFGFQVDDIAATAERLAAAGIKPRDDINAALQIGHEKRAGGNVEVKYAAPDGVTVDISETGWVGSSGFNPS
jgi:glyoxylase I family protein